MRTKESHEINFKRNFRIYWGIISKYKLILFFLIIFFFLREIRVVLEKFLFKAVLDGGTQFNSG